MSRPYVFLADRETDGRSKRSHERAKTRLAAISETAARRSSRQAHQVTSQEIDLAFIREFHVLGSRLGFSHSERVENVRKAIYANHRDKLAFCGQQLSYADAFRIWCGRALEQRSSKTPTPLKRREEDFEHDVNESREAGRSAADRGQQGIRDGESAAEDAEGLEGETE
jgi:hypothetical protein